MNLEVSIAILPFAEFVFVYYKFYFTIKVFKIYVTIKFFLFNISLAVEIGNLFVCLFVYWLNCMFTC